MGCCASKPHEEPLLVRLLLSIHFYLLLLTYANGWSCTAAEAPTGCQHHGCSCLGWQAHARRLQGGLIAAVPQTWHLTSSLLNPNAPSALQLWPFVASCPASYPYRAYTRVVEQDTHVFAALFTGVGGHQAAEHCISNCYEVFTKALQQAEPDRALRQTVQQLEASYFAMQNLSDQVRLRSLLRPPRDTHVTATSSNKQPLFGSVSAAAPQATAHEPVQRQEPPLSVPPCTV
jgi:hypothetical protein